MMMMFRNILLVSVVIAGCLAASLQTEEQKAINKRYGICQSQADCSSDECCVLSAQRYSYPSCQPMRREGDMCRPTAVTSSSRIEFPDKSIFEYTDAHLHLCPCAANLRCEKGEDNQMAKCT